jgi:hypothetical protein
MPILKPRMMSRSFSLLMLLGTIAVAAFLPAANAQSLGRSFYVDPSGSDSNSGTSPNSPWRTVARVNALSFAPGDTVYFKRGGIWRETLEPRRGGAPSRPVTFTGYGIGSGPQPIINGSDVVSGWTGAGGTVYRAHAEKTANIYVDGRPGWGLLHACCGPGSSCAPSGSCAVGPMEAGSWMWNPATNELSVWMPDGSDPGTHTIEAATRDFGMNVVGDGGEKSNLVVDGITFMRTAGGGLYFFSNDDGGVGFTGIVVRNCFVTQTGTGHIDDGSYHNGIHYSQHVELPSAPIFQHNRISFTGNHGNGINSQAADGAQLLYNDVSQFNHSGLDMKHSNGDIVRGNIVHDSFDTNAIYQEYCVGGLIENNVIYNVPGTRPGRGSGIQIDVDSTGARIFNNSIYNVFTGLYLIHAATVQYNAVANATHAAVDAKEGGDFAHNVWAPSPVFFLNNQSYDITTWKMIGHADDIAGDPMWSDPAHGHFNVPPSSPLIAARAGVTTSANSATH